MSQSRRIWISGILIILILILTGAGILVLMKTGEESTAKIQEPPRRVAVVLQELVPRPFTKMAEAYANVSPLKKGTVSARISGPIDRISPDAEPGRSVSKGEVMGRIEETRYGIALEKAEASLNKFKALLKIERSDNEKRLALYNIAKQRFELARSDYDRKKVLYEGKLIAKQELEIAESQLELQRSELENARSELRKRESRIQSVQADIASAEAEIKRLKEDLSDTFIRAPFDGVIGERYVEVGDQVSPNQKLFTVLDVSTVKVIARIPSDEISRVKLGVSVQVSTRAYPEMGFIGQVAYIHPEADPKNRTFSVEVHVKNRGEPMLMPGMFSRVQIPLRKFDKALMVPRDVLLEDEKGPYLYVADKSNRRARRRDVVVGELGPEEALIVSGVKTGESLIVRGQELLNDGALIHWEKEGPGPSPNQIPKADN
jgi:multidrug efflux pump subunit AcrA (membrane-fusion protein)